MLIKNVGSNGNLVISEHTLKLVGSVIHDPHRIQLTFCAGPTEVLSLIILFSSSFK